MYTGYPIFPGENEQEQLACIMEVMGLPEKYLVDRSSRKRLFFGTLPTPFDSPAAAYSPPSLRLDWCAAPRRQLEGPSSSSRHQDTRPGPEVRRRALCRLHRQVPHVGPRPSSQARPRDAPPLDRRRARSRSQPADPTSEQSLLARALAGQRQLHGRLPSNLYSSQEDLLCHFGVQRPSAAHSRPV